MVDICQVRPIASLACTRDLRPVERGAARVEHEVEAGLASAASRSASVARSQSSSVPTNFSGFAGGQLQVEVVEAVVAQQVEHELQQRPELVLHLLAGAVDVRVVLGQARGRG